MIDLLLALHGLAQKRGEGPALVEGLRKTPGVGDGPLIVISEEARKTSIYRKLSKLAVATAIRRKRPDRRQRSPPL